MSAELLSAMSIAHSLRFDRFSNLLTMVYSSPHLHRPNGHWDAINLRQQVIRCFDALGFCEFDHSTAQVHMCPPSLVLLPGLGAPCGLFTGARVPATSRGLQQAVLRAGSLALLHQHPQSIAGIDLPPRIVVEAVDQETLGTIAKAAGLDSDLKDPAAWKFANFSLALPQISSALSFEPRQELNWPCRIFYADLLKFSAARMKTAPVLRLAEYRNPRTSQRRHWLWRGAAATEIDRDWGRFFVLAEQDLTVLLYDASSRTLVVPATTPLPALLARAAALSTGVPPSVTATGHRIASMPAGHPLLLYRNVPSVIAELIAGKLDQRLVPINLEGIVKKGNSHD